MPTTARSSTRVKAAAVWRGVKGLRDEGVRVPRSRDASPRLRDTDVLTRGMWNLRKGNFEKRSCIEALADLAAG